MDLGATERGTQEAGVQTFWDRETQLSIRVRKLAEFLRPRPLHGITLHPHPWTESRQPYYVFNPGAGYSETRCIDEAGIPYQQGSTGRLYHPLIVGEYALQVLDEGADRDPEQARAAALKVLPAIVSSARATGAWGRGGSPGSMSSPRASAPLQGLMISALTRLTSGRPSPEIVEVIDRAINRMISPESEGGALSSLDGFPFLEEAPATPLKHILGGCATALFGLYDAADALGHCRAAETAREVERSICATIDRFVAPFGWSFYSPLAYGRPYLASLHYHRLIIAKIRLIGIRTSEERLLRTAAAWEGALESAARRWAAGTAKAIQVFWMRDVRGLDLQLCP